jgi:hypothetical protein
MAQASIGRRLVRASALGTCLGFGVAAVVIACLAAARLWVDCSSLSAAECAFEEQLAHSAARLQVLGAIGCGALSIGGGLLLRRRE